MLTDGQVRDAKTVIELAKDGVEKNQFTRIHTFGIGSGCDKDLVQKIASAGRGASSLVEGDDTANLSKMVIRALARAQHPSMKDCSLKWGKSPTTHLGEIYRNEMVTDYKILSKANFDQM